MNTSVLYCITAIAQRVDKWVEVLFFIQAKYILIIQTIAEEYFPCERLIAATFAGRKCPSVREKQNCTVAELNGLNCKCADVFIAGPETNERARDGPASLWELIEVAAHLQLAALPEICSSPKPAKSYKS